MSQDWSNPSTARQWDLKGNERNPIRSEQLDILVTILEKSYDPEKWILDLGYGSGQVEELIFDRIPRASVVGVDNSQAMMDLARNRLRGYSNPFESVMHDLGKIESLVLPRHTYQFVIAVQSLHHLSNDQMREAYKYVYKSLETNGLFLLLDKVQVETEGLWGIMNTVWQRQDRLYHSGVAVHEGHSFEEHTQRVLDRGDYPVLLDEQMLWLREAGFEAACVHLHAHRAFVVGMKRDRKQS